MGPWTKLARSVTRNTIASAISSGAAGRPAGACADPAMPDALEVAAKQDAYFASTGKLIGPLHGVVFSIKDQYDTFDMRTTAGMDAAYANDRPPRDATFVKRLRDAGAIILAKANLGEMGSPNSRSSFGGPSLRYRAHSRHVERRVRSLGRRQPGDLLHRRGDRRLHPSWDSVNAFLSICSRMTPIRIPFSVRSLAKLR
jgi:hypothetical protein